MKLSMSFAKGMKWRLSIFKNPPTHAEKYDLDQGSRIEELTIKGGTTNSYENK